MSKKDYELIARCINGAVKAHGQTAAIILAVDNLAMELRSTNPRFDELRFRNACGVEA